MLRRLVALVILSNTFAATGYAQTSVTPIDRVVALELARADWARSRDVSTSVNLLDVDPRTLPPLDVRAEWTQAPGAGAKTSERSWGWKLLGGAIGGTAGFFAGGYLGAWLEPDCHCDDPGLKGALIGAPIGAVAGAIVGVKLF